MHIPSATRQIPTPPGMHTPPRVAGDRAQPQPRQEAPHAAPAADQRKDNGRLERMHDALAHRMARIRAAHRAQPADVQPTTSNPNTDGPSADGPAAAHRNGMHVARGHGMRVAHRHAPAAPGPNVPEVPSEPNVTAAPVETATVPGDGGEQHSGQIFHDLMDAVHSMLGAYSKQMPGAETGLELRGLSKQFGLALRDIYARQQSGELDDAGVHQAINDAFHMLVEGLSSLSGGSGAPEEPADPSLQAVDLSGTVQAIPAGIESPTVEAPAAPEMVEPTSTMQATPAGAVPPQYGHPGGLKGVLFQGTITAMPDLGMVDAPGSSDVPNVPPAGSDGAGPVQSDRLRSILRALRQLRANLDPGGPGRRRGLMPNAAPGQGAVPAPKPAAPAAPSAGGLPVESRFAAARSAFADLRGAHEHTHPGRHFDRVG